jgi:hypothetical protein
LLGVAVAPALASYKAQMKAGTLQILGNGASDKLALEVATDDPSTVVVDVGEDGTADFRFDRSTFTAIDVQAGGGSGSQVLLRGLAPEIGIAGSEGANDTLEINTLGGNDKVMVAPDVSQLITPEVDLGADQ